MISALRKGDLEYVRSVVPSSVHVDQPLEWYRGGPSTTLALLAVDANAADSLGYFLELGANAWAKDHTGTNLFGKVARGGHLNKKIVDMVFTEDNAGEFLNDQTISGNTVAHLAVISHNLLVLSALLNASGMVRVATVRNKAGDTPLTLALKLADGNPTVPSMLVRYALNVSWEPLSVTDRDGNTPLELATRFKLGEVVDRIVNPTCGRKCRREEPAARGTSPEVETDFDGGSQAEYPTFGATVERKALADEIVLLTEEIEYLRSSRKGEESREGRKEVESEDEEMTFDDRDKDDLPVSAGEPHEGDTLLDTTSKTDRVAAGKRPAEEECRRCECRSAEAVNARLSEEVDALKTAVNELNDELDAANGDRADEKMIMRRKHDDLVRVLTATHEEEMNGIGDELDAELSAQSKIYAEKVRALRADHAGDLDRLQKKIKEEFDVQYGEFYAALIDRQTTVHDIAVGVADISI